MNGIYSNESQIQIFSSRTQNSKLSNPVKRMNESMLSGNMKQSSFIEDPPLKYSLPSEELFNFSSDPYG